ncbi:arginase family protein [Mesorhizobium sp. M0615]|uniref:arginase family protein n=1 Tax=Mesorhizobium sp. M0615 TaxID=2956971 RepID=UPI0033388C31
MGSPTLGDLPLFISGSSANFPRRPATRRRDIHVRPTAREWISARGQFGPTFRPLFLQTRNSFAPGARGLSSAGPQEVADAKAWGVRFFPEQAVRQKGIQPILDAIPSGSNVHINLDFDGLDPTIMPAVFVPAPGGLLYWEVVDLIKSVAAKATMCGIAAVEFVPSKDPDGNSALTAGRIISLAIGSILKKSSV